MADEDFAELLRRYRVAAGLTQAELGARAGVSANTIGSLERGLRERPRRKTVQVLAKALGLTGGDRDRLVFASAGWRGGGRPPVASRDDEAQDAEIGPVCWAGLTPRSLPRDVGDFTGRKGEVRELRKLIGSAAGSSAAVVAVVQGMGGVGKTALAVHVAHQLAEKFPDGQLYIDLRGFGTGRPMTARNALSLLLDALGVSEQMGGDLDSIVARYRSVIAGKQVLLVLDDAPGSAQIADLLPVTAGSAAIVTSRRSLVTLAGVRHIRLDVFAEQEAAALLAAIVGGIRVEADPASVGEVVRLCGCLPLAIRMAGARLVMRPQWSVATLAEHLSDERRRLDQLQHDNVGIRASFGESLDQLIVSQDPLDNAAGTAFPILGLPDGPDLGLAMAAGLLDVPEQEAEQVLDRLVDSFLIQPRERGCYRLHDLARTFARESAGEGRSQPGRRQSSMA